MAINEITDKIRKSINTIYTVYYISFLSDCMTIFSVLKPYTSLDSMYCLCIQVENLTAITESEQTMAAYLQNSFFSAGYLMAASIVALKCLNLVPDLAAWMIPEGDTAFSTRNFGEGVAQQAKVSTQGMISKVL